MKFLKPWGCQRLSFLLEKAASREDKMWRIYVPKKPSSLDTDVSPAQRDEAVRWLTELHGRLQLYPESLALAVSILDRFLASIKARPKYLRCIAIACFFLAAKTCEEDEHVPPLKELAACSSCGCSPSEILRMERIILDKLNWDLHTATALDFLHIFHAMALSCRSGLLDSTLGLNTSQHLGLLTRRLYRCLADHRLLQLRGSLLALALVSLELEACCPDWLALTIELLRRAQVDSSRLIGSRELVAHSLSAPHNTVYIYQPLQRQQAQASGSLGVLTSTPESPRDHALFTITPAQPLPPAGVEEGDQHLWSSGSSSFTSSSIPALLSPRTRLHHHNQLQKAPLRCKASTKRKVEEMEVDDFYNEDTTTTAVQEGAAASGGGGLGVRGVLLSRQEGSSSPCPPLQPVGAS